MKIPMLKSWLFKTSILSICLSLILSCVKKTGFSYRRVNVEFLANNQRIIGDATAILYDDNRLALYTTPPNREKADLSKLGPKFLIQIAPTSSPIPYASKFKATINNISLVSGLDQPFCFYTIDTAANLKFSFWIDSTSKNLHYVKGRFEGQYYLGANGNIFNDPQLQDTLKITEGKFELCK
jgi:hypothetical protein